MGYSPWNHKQVNMTEQLTLSCLPTHGYTYLFFHVRNYGFCPHICLFRHSVVSDFLQPHGLQHPRLPCPSPTPRACSNSCPSSWGCHPTISSSVVPFSSCLQSFPASGSFLMSQFFASGGQSIGATASLSVLFVCVLILKLPCKKCIFFHCYKLIICKASAHNAGDRGSIPGSGRSPGEGNGNPLQHSYLENPMDGEA